jgi:hypothetical protein
MVGVGKDWAVVLIFLAAVVGLTVLEALWITRKGWSGFGRAFGFSAVTNFVGFAVGSFVAFVVFGVVAAMAWDGSLAKFPLHDYGIIAFLAFGVLFFPSFLMLCKRLFLKLFKIQSGRAAWLFSLVGSLAIFIISFGLPVLAVYLI